ncbi:MAG: glycosyl transferase, partial [Draconibacterium sp.]
TASDNVQEELKRKIRIAAGAYQTMSRLSALMNPFKHGILSFQFWSRKVFRWVLVPFSLIALIPLNIILAYRTHFDWYHIYTQILALQMLYYGFVLIGKLLENKSVRSKIIFVPYYVFMMNYAAIMGAVRYFSGKQSVKWERAKRAQM